MPVKRHQYGAWQGPSSVHLVLSWPRHIKSWELDNMWWPQDINSFERHINSWELDNMATRSFFRGNDIHVVASRCCIEGTTFISHGHDFLC